MGSNFTAKVTRHGGLLERLREHTGTAHVNETEAADEIERLRAGLIIQAELWDAASAQLDASDDRLGWVRFTVAHQPAQHARAAAAAGGE